jgi:hypothetical protein
MTPESKSKELIDKFRPFCDGVFEDDLNKNAQQCAIICVQEILASSDHAGGWDEYWQDVLNYLNY